MSAKSGMPDLITGAAAGAVGGLMATVAMTATMLVLHRVLPQRRKKQLPPVTITNQVIEKTGLPSQLKENKLTGMPLAAHYGYGTAVGALYTPVIQAPGSPLLKGIGLGLGVWAGNYLGLMPALDLYPSAKREPARMNGLMIVAHVIWGGVTALLAEGVYRKLHHART